MSDRAYCQCGKLLTEDNVCPLPSGVVCKGQQFTPADALMQQSAPEPEQKSSLDGLEDIL